MKQKTPVQKMCADYILVVRAHMSFADLLAAENSVVMSMTSIEGARYFAGSIF